MELIIKELPEMELKDVVCVYVGKPDSCMCGCSGKYSYTTVNKMKATARRGYEVKEAEVNDKEVERIIDFVRMSAGKEISVLSVDSGFCLTIIIDEVQYSIYTL